ncbi:MAG TPA: SprB repeat-containing protein, partial [Chitinophaga sp.]
MKCYNWRPLLPGRLVRGRLSLKVPCKRALQWMFVWLTGFALGLPARTCGQDIYLQNPSLEGPPAIGKVPPGWNECGNTPDTQPQQVVYCGITLPASAGKTYAGLLCTTYLEEGLSQQLATPLKAGVTYTISFDMAYPTYYCIHTCYGQMVLYGGDAARDKGEVLWMSPEFTNTGWQRFTATFTPKADHPYLSCWAHVDRHCTSSTASAVLIDNFSPSVRAVPQLSVSARASCKDASTGQAVVAVNACTGPFKYEWTNTNSTSARADHLRKGWYTVKVTSESGTEATAGVEVGEVEIQAEATATAASCYGLADARIEVQPQGGTQPYTFSYDGGQTFG